MVYVFTYELVHGHVCVRVHSQTSTWYIVCMPTATEKAMLEAKSIHAVSIGITAYLFLPLPFPLPNLALRSS